ncbi:hypothetical protein Nepgr_003743 [Nepenthes gracilis]|uniref:VQ domain-containing protein n=1 Tax=Nepenthes gracilis TaxID=150966 RepID=A0AAD3XE30_NEPGR|nr:hypothetical protein Nepgr_003743 [Nepenthes gracilis]
MSPPRYKNVVENPRKSAPVTINGTRPSPLKTNRQYCRPVTPRPSSSFSNFTTAETTTTVAAAHRPRREPVIIYTHSPKVIHTHARDFMALVQELTGLSSTGQTAGKNREDCNHGGCCDGEPDGDDPPSLSIRGGSGRDNDNVKVSLSLEISTPTTFDPPNTRIGDISLDTPTAADLFLSPPHSHRYSDVVIQSPNNGSSFKLIRVWGETKHIEFVELHVLWISLPFPSLSLSSPTLLHSNGVEEVKSAESKKMKYWKTRSLFGQKARVR